ncbi:MAG TPA: HAD-IA family hydrolase, partial [Dehalococcoidia bacterium]
VVVNSCREGCAKPEARIYRLTLERLGLPAEAAVFVDDVEANVEGARAVGMAGVRFVDYQGLVRDLRALGVAC